MVTAGKSHYALKNSTKHEFSDTNVIEMNNIMEDLVPGRTQEEELLETVQAILINHPTKVLFNRSNSTLRTREFENREKENESLPRIVNRNDSLYISNKTRR